MRTYGAVPDDSRAAKDAMGEQWNQQTKGWGDSIVIRPRPYNATQAMLGMSNITAASHALDVAASAGDQIDIVQCVGRDGSVAGTRRRTFYSSQVSRLQRHVDKK